MIKCVFCLTTAEMVRATPDSAAERPDNWTTVTVDQRGKPIRNSTVCPECIIYVPALLR